MITIRNNAGYYLERVICLEYKENYRKEYKKYGRNSGLKYKNSKERLQQIKEKYKNGITYKMILEMI